MNNLLKQTKPTQSEFFTNKEVLRKRARQHVEEGAVTVGYAAHRATVVSLLNDALATELVCVLRYKRHYFMAKGIHSESVKTEFLQHAIEEMKHADSLAKRIVELGGEPDFSPETLTARSHAEYKAGDTVLSMLKENLIAERIAIESYREMVAYLANDDPTTQRLIKEILSVEEEHADDTLSLLEGMQNTTIHI